MINYIILNIMGLNNIQKAKKNQFGCFLLFRMNFFVHYKICKHLEKEDFMTFQSELGYCDLHPLYEPILL